MSRVPRLEILVGVLGSGKTSYARRRASVILPAEKIVPPSHQVTPKKSRKIDPSDIPSSQRPAGMLALPTVVHGPVENAGMFRPGALTVSYEDVVTHLHGSFREDSRLRRCYSRIMEDMAKSILLAGWDAVVDDYHLSTESRYRWREFADDFRRAAPLELIAVVFPVDRPEIHARRRFRYDPNRFSYENLLGAAQVHCEQWSLAPFSLTNEGYDREVDGPAPVVTLDDI